ASFWRTCPSPTSPTTDPRRRARQTACFPTREHARLRCAGRTLRTITQDANRQTSLPYGLSATLAGANAHAIIQRQDEDLAVSHLAGVLGTGRMDDRFDGRLQVLVADGDFHL